MYTFSEVRILKAGYIIDALYKIAVENTAAGNAVQDGTVTSITDALAEQLPEPSEIQKLTASPKAPMKLKTKKLQYRLLP